MGDAGSSPPPPSPSRPQPVRAGLPSATPTKSFWQTSFPNSLVHHRSTPELPTHADVVVVGTGISGTFAVDELLKNDGLTVLALEARTLCSAATGRNGGHLQPLIHSAPAHIIDFELRNFHHVEALALNGLRGGDDDDNDEDDEGHGKVDGNEPQSKTSSSPSASSSSSPSWCDFRRLEGCLGFWNEEYFKEAKRDLAAAAATHVARDTDNCKNKNLPVEEHTYAGLARVVDEPKELEALGLRVQSGAVGAIVQSVAASLSPYKLCVGLWRRLLGKFEQEDQSDGTERTGDSQDPEARASRQRYRLNLQTDTPVTMLERGDDGWIVHSPRGSVHAHTVILTTNAYTSHLLPQFAPLIRPVQAQMSALVPPPSSSGHCNTTTTTTTTSGSGVGNAHKEIHGGGGTGKLIPMSYGFMGVGSMDRVMSDYLVQNPYITTSTSPSPSAGGHLMFGGGRHLCLHHGEGVWDDDFVDKNVERYLRSLPERLNLNLDRDLDKRDPGPMHGEDQNRLQDEVGSPPLPSLQSPSSQLLDIAASWTGIIGHSADGHPWVGAAPEPEHAGIFVCAGYTGHGMTNAPLCGRAVARRALRAPRGARADNMMMMMMEKDETPEVHVDVDMDVPPEYLITRERIERVLQSYA